MALKVNQFVSSLAPESQTFLNYVPSLLPPPNSFPNSHPRDQFLQPAKQHSRLQSGLNTALGTARTFSSPSPSIAAAVGGDGGWEPSPGLESPSPTALVFQAQEGAEVFLCSQGWILAGPETKVPTKQLSLHSPRAKSLVSLSGLFLLRQLLSWLLVTYIKGTRMRFLA